MLELSVPAVFLAGLAASPHCSLMCGPWQALQLRGRGGLPLAQALGFLHGGRIAGYGVLGAAAGATGSGLAFLLPPVTAGTVLQAASAGALALLGALQLSRRGRAACCPPATGGSPRALAARGMLWALMPCASLYAMLPLALFSGSALAGAALLAAFGAGTLPALGASGGVLARLGLRPSPLAASVLIGAGALGLLGAGAAPAFAAWCQAQL